jgi:hypothetical protein
MIEYCPSLFMFSLAAPLAADRQVTLSIERRMLIATRMYAGLQTSFAHWEQAPGPDVDRECLARPA